MANIQYHMVEPENNNASGSYTEFNTADFILTGSDRKYVKNSLRLEGTIVVKKNNVEKALEMDVPFLQQLKMIPGIRAGR